MNGCKICCNAILFQNIISDISGEDKNIQTMWHLWESEGGFQVKIMKRGELRNVFALLLASTTTFPKHCFIKRNQSAVFQQKTQVRLQWCYRLILQKITLLHIKMKSRQPTGPFHCCCMEQSRGAILSYCQ